jgi:hypothetical protein
MTTRSVTIWGMDTHIDYPNGIIPWENVQGQQLHPYSCYDVNGQLVTITPKYPSTHSSWEGIQADPAYHYNLGLIILHPDEVELSLSQNPQAVQHRQEGQVLTYSKISYIMSLNAPASPQFPTDKTSITIKYTNDGNYSLTSQIFRTWR